MAHQRLSLFEAGVIEEINFVRTNPMGMVAKLQATRKYFNGKLYQVPGRATLVTNEGVSTVDECIQYLQKMANSAKLGVLAASQGMCLAAADHVADIGPKGITGHVGTDKSDPFARLRRHGQWQITAGENIDFGHDQAEDVVRALLLDDGVPGRGHRFNLMDPNFASIGVASGPHAKFGNMCVITLAGGFVDGPSADSQGDNLVRLVMREEHELTQIFTCSICSREIGDSWISASDMRFHKECFVCAHCGRQCDSYFLKDEKIYCASDYRALFNATLATDPCYCCGQPLGAQVLSALGQKFHRECFVCMNCKKQLTESFHLENGAPFCGPCHAEQFAIRCSRCFQPITGQALNALGKAFHGECFVCSECSCPLTSTFALKNNFPVCEPCAQK